MDEQNPYEPPKSLVTDPAAPDYPDLRARVWTLASWIFVFGINLAVPLIFSSSMTDEHGKLGMFIAVTSLLFSGCLVCAVRRELAVSLLIGGALVGLMQVFPLLQFLAGVIGMAAGSCFGLAEFGGDERSPRLTSELGGFVVTLITGGSLMTAAACLGWPIQWFMARRRKTRGTIRSAGGLRSD